MVKTYHPALRHPSFPKEGIFTIISSFWKEEYPSHRRGGGGRYLDVKNWERITTINHI
jgi:hypothetical protein